jgi:pheromone shutdown protein TraB
LKPQIFLNLRDRYIATLIEMILASKKYNKILALTGIMENESITQILDNELLLRQN